MIFLLVKGTFRKFPVQAKLSFSSYACCVHAMGGRESFLLSEASCTVHGFAWTVSNLAWTVDQWYFLISNNILDFEVYHRMGSFEWTSDLFNSDDHLVEFLTTWQT